METHLQVMLILRTPLSLDEKNIKKSEIGKLLKELDPTGDEILSNYDTTGIGYPSKQWYNNALADSVNAIFENDNDSDIIAEISNTYGDKTVLGTVRKDADGNTYVEINEDILKGIEEDDYEKRIKEEEKRTKKVLTKIFEDGVKYKNNIFTMNKNDKNEFIRNKTMTYYLHNDNQVRLAKLRLSKNAMEIINNAKNWKNVEKKYINTNNKHLVDFAYGYLNVSVLGNDYKVKVVMGADKFGNIHLYDISDMERIKIKGRTNTTVHSIKGASMFNGSSKNNISESKMNVNKILNQDRNMEKQ